MFTNHTQCRACGYGKSATPGTKSGPTEKLTEVFNLGIQPLANDFCKDGQEHSGYAPLKVMFCPRCTLGQLSVVVRPDILYRHYTYVTSPSATMQHHFEQLHADILAEADGSNLLEIGSNDGALLEQFRKWGWDVMGIDPAENLHRIAKARGVDSMCDLFREESAKTLSTIMVPDVILARHVFCHADDWHDFVHGLELLAGKETVICIEVPYGVDTLANCEWDTIYHEHLSYLTLKSVVALLRDSNLRLCRVIRYAIHGGAIMLVIRSKNSDRGPDGELEKLLDEEKVTEETWGEFVASSVASQEALTRAVRECAGNVAALGASAKSTVWINACGFTRHDIRFISDSTPQKWWTTTPGSDIPVTDEGALLRELPGHTVCFAWNFADEILQKQELYRSKGGKFIIPVPKLRVL